MAATSVPSKRLTPASERRASERSRTEFGVVVRQGVTSEQARCIDVSSTGLLLARPQSASEEDGTSVEPVLTRLELQLPERARALHAWARPVWSQGPLAAYRILQMHDVDRLSFAEHRDLISRRELRT